MPELFSMTWQAYSAPSNIYFGHSDIIKSQEGVQQGDPLGPLFFWLGSASQADRLKIGDGGI